MKKAFLLAITILFSSSVFAQPNAISPPVNTPKLFERIMNTPITKKALTTGNQRAGVFVLANKGKIALGTLNNPEKMSEFFLVHPELLDKFIQYYTFANVKQQLA